jgi:arylsulfatase
VVPTILDIAGVDVSSPEAGPALPGRSLVPLFQENETWDERTLFWAHSGNRAIRQGDWKAVTRRDNDNRWELYNIANDRAELNDLASAESKRLDRLAATWDSLRVQYDKDFEAGEVE